MGLNDEADLASQLEHLRQRGEALQRESAKTRSDILGLLGLSEDGAVTVHYDADGLMSSVEIDEDARRDLTSAALVREINAAIIRSGVFLSGRNAQDAVQPPLDAAIAARVSQLSAETHGSRPEPQKISNDFGTVTVTALLGNIAGVACAESWIGSTSSRLISEEIVRVARIAAKETDTVGKYT